MAKAIIINKIDKTTGTYYPICSRCSNSVSYIEMSKETIKWASFNDANYSPWCGAKFVKKKVKK